MTSMIHSLYNIRLLDDLAQKDSIIHRIHPLIKLLTTVLYLAVVISFDRTETTRLFPLFFYPILLFILADVPVAPILKRMLLIEPLILGVGILNPWFDTQSVLVGGFFISRGWLTFLSILLKSVLTVTVSILLVATTGMEGLASALRMLRIPKLFVLQLLLTYRYISVLLEEVFRMERAHSLRSNGKKGIHYKAWGSFIGQLIIKTYDRAQRIYQSMCLRGFRGEYQIGLSKPIGYMDILYLTAWGGIFLLVRKYDLPSLIGTWLIQLIG